MILIINELSQNRVKVKGSLVLNGENLLDARQSKVEPLVTGSTQSPVFTPIWGYVEGRVINLSLKLLIK